MLHTTLWWQVQSLNHILISQQTPQTSTDTPYLALTGELWGVCCEDLGINWLCVIRAPHCTLKKTFTDCGQNWACWWPSAGTVINKFGSCVYQRQILEEMAMIDKSQMTKMSFYQHGLTVIPEWTSHHIPNKVWDGMIYPFPRHHCKFGNGK